jgi:TRAP-type C4-dicarboxylate transport system permease large subunit
MEVGNISIERYTKAILPYIGILILVLMLLVFIPQLVLWLPNLVVR